MTRGLVRRVVDGIVYEETVDMKYSPDQPRDDHGRWGEGSSGTGLSTLASARGDGDNPGWRGMTDVQYATYMGGYCGEFAMALHEVYGLHVALSLAFDGGLDHAFAYDDKGNAWDAGGRDTKANLEATVTSYETHDHIEANVSRDRLAEVNHGFNQKVFESAVRIVSGR